MGYNVSMIAESTSHWGNMCRIDEVMRRLVLWGVKGEFYSEQPGMAGCTYYMKIGTCGHMVTTADIINFRSPVLLWNTKVSLLQRMAMVLVVVGTTTSQLGQVTQGVCKENVEC